MVLLQNIMTLHLTMCWAEPRGENSAVKLQGKHRGGSVNDPYSSTGYYTSLHLYSLWNKYKNYIKTAITNLNQNYLACIPRVAIYKMIYTNFGNNSTNIDYSCIM